MKKSIALIYGGEGCEREISIKSAENLASYIDGNQYKILPIEISKSGDWYLRKSVCEKKDGIPVYPVFVDGVSGFLANGAIIHIDGAIICLHGDFGEDGAVQGALKTAHIKYLGQEVITAAITSDKAFTKLAAERLGIPTAKWELCVDEEPKSARLRAEKSVGYPMFIKPARLGSSFGAHPVLSREDFDTAYLDAQSMGCGRVLIEELVDISYELECALFDDGVRIISPNGKILSNGAFYDFEAKYSKDSNIEASALKAEDGEKERAEAKRNSNLLADFIGLKYLSRIDFFVTADKRVIFNEINTIPGMTKTSLYPKLTENLGMRQGEFINRLIKEVTGNDGNL